MLISRECDYATRTMRALSCGERLSVQSICDIECIPHAYAYKILKKLEKAHLVQGFRGAQGGYQSLRTPDQVTLYDVYQAVDGPLFINDCMQEGHHCPRNEANSPCLVHCALNDFQSEIVDKMEGLVLSEILPEAL